MTTHDDFLIDEERRYTLSPKEKKAVVQDITGFLRDYREILFSYLHGSFLEDLPFRDVDLAVYFDETMSAARRFDLCSDLATALSRLICIPVDVHALNGASPGFCYHVTKGLVLWSRDEEKRCGFAEQTWMTYFDYQPVLRQILDDLIADMGDTPAHQAAGKDRPRKTG